MGHTGRYVALLRHGEAQRDPDDVLVGRLKPSGVLQARSAATHLAPLGLRRVVSSPTPRAVETAELLRAGEVETDGGLSGLRLGPYDDRPLTGLPHFETLFADPAHRPPGGESLVDLLERSRAALDRCFSVASRVAAVAHRVVNSVLLGDLLGLDIAAAVAVQQDPGAVNLIWRRPSGDHVVCVNVDPADPLRTSAAGRSLPDVNVAVEQRVYLVRHGEARNLGAGRMHSSGAHALTERGREQAQALGERFSALTDPIVVASDLERAATTAQIVAGGVRVVQSPALREISLGDLDGAPFEAVFEACPDFMRDPDARLPGGESPIECGERAGAELDRILASTGGRDVVAVCHGAVHRMVAARLLGFPPAVGARMRTDWAGVTILDRAAGRWWLRSANWTPGGASELAHTRPIPRFSDEQSTVLGY